MDTQIFWERMSTKQRRIAEAARKYPGYRSVVKERKSIVEHPFETIKRAMDPGYCLCKGKVSGEFALTFLAYNMKRVINILGTKNLLKALRLMR